MPAVPNHRASTGERINSAETTGSLQETLAKKGIRLTRQRRVILQVMDDAEQHLDVDQILERAQKIDQGVHLDEGMRMIQRAVEQRPDDGYIVDSLGWAYFRTGNNDEAVKHLERAVNEGDLSFSTIVPSDCLVLIL